jgi:uncharacterized protein YuzE
LGILGTAKGPVLLDQNEEGNMAGVETRKAAESILKT